MPGQARQYKAPHTLRVSLTKTSLGSTVGAHTGCVHVSIWKVAVGFPSVGAPCHPGPEPENLCSLQRGSVRGRAIALTPKRQKLGGACLS